MPISLAHFIIVETCNTCSRLANRTQISSRNSSSCSPAAIDRVCVCARAPVPAEQAKRNKVNARAAGHCANWPSAPSVGVDCFARCAGDNYKCTSIGIDWPAIGRHQVSFEWHTQGSATSVSSWADQRKAIVASSSWRETLQLFMLGREAARVG